MGFQKFDWYSWCVVVVGWIVVLGLWLLGTISMYILGTYSVQWGVFVFDFVRFSLCILSLFLGFSLLFVVEALRLESKVMLGFRVVSSLLCYCCVKVLGF